jgi:hypothetical protein
MKLFWPRNLKKELTKCPREKYFKNISEIISLSNRISFRLLRLNKSLKNIVMKLVFLLTKKQIKLINRLLSEIKSISCRR